VPGFLKGTGKGWVNSDFGNGYRVPKRSAPRASGAGRKQSGADNWKSRVIGRSLRAVTDQEALGERTYGGLRRASGGWRKRARRRYRSVVALAWHSSAWTAGGDLEEFAA